MSKTIESPDSVLEKAVSVEQITPAAREAVLRAEEFARSHDQSQLIPLLGTFDDMMTLEELQEMREMD
jgi:hypothetical protein